MGRMRIMDRTGHTTMEWTVGDRTQEEVDREFKRMVLQGYSAFKIDPESKQGTMLKGFDPEAEEIILAVPLVGG